MNKPDLKPRQLEARRLYNRKCNGFLLPFRLLALLGWGALLLQLYFERARFADSEYSPLAFLLLASLVLASFVGVGADGAHRRAFDAVRDAGLLDEENEIVRRTATTFPGADLTLNNSSRHWGSVGVALALLGVAALLVWFGISFTSNIAERILTALGCAFFSGYALLSFATRNRPSLQLDERGVFSYYLGFWPRLVRWHEIESARFLRWTNFHDGAEIHNIELKNAENKTLLTLNAATFVGAPPEFQAGFAAELRRRLTGKLSV